MLTFPWEKKNRILNQASPIKYHIAFLIFQNHLRMNTKIYFVFTFPSFETHSDTLKKKQLCAVQKILHVLLMQTKRHKKLDLHNEWERDLFWKYKIHVVISPCVHSCHSPPPYSPLYPPACLQPPPPPPLSPHSVQFTQFPLVSFLTRVSFEEITCKTRHPSLRLVTVLGNQILCLPSISAAR